MATDKLEVIDSAVRDVHLWINEIARELDWADRHYAFKALRVVLHALRDRLMVDQVAHLSAQLPLIVRGVFYESWDPSRTPMTYRHLDQFSDRILSEFTGYELEVDPIPVAQAVFAVLARHISPGEIEKIVRTLPEPLRLLWPARSGAT